jgi:hypothetical protein
MSADWGFGAVGDALTAKAPHSTPERAARASNGNDSHAIQSRDARFHRFHLLRRR